MKSVRFEQLSLIMILWLAPLIAHAQPELDLALKAGANSATQAEDSRADRYGFSGGIAGSLQWPIVGRYWCAAQLELLYTPRGAEVIFEGEHVGKFREHYLDLTATARPEARMGPASVYLLLGGGVNFLMSATKDDTAAMGQDITGALHRIDVELLGGAGVALQLSQSGLGPLRLGSLFLEVRHDIGLLDVDMTNGGFKNRTSSVMLGLSFVVAAGTRPQPDTGTIE